MRQFFKKFLPKKITSKIYHSKTKINFVLIKIFSKNYFLASLYYFVLSKEFYREQRSVLLGRIVYKRSLNEIKESCALLRRNIHRLEKGLIMKPRRDIFAEAYIGETVDCYNKALRSKLLCIEERRWAHDVLTQYFYVVKANKQISIAKQNFKQSKMFNVQNSYIPYQYKDLPESRVNYDQLYNLFQRRRSVRWYKPISVPENLIKQAVNAATLAPSACNRQPYNFFVVNNNDQATEVAELAMGTTGWSENIQCIIAVIGDLSAYPSERDRHVIYIDSSLAAMQLMLAFEVLGLSSCPINWPDVESREKLISKKLNLPYHKRVVMLISVGYAEPDGGIPFSQKKNDNILIKEVN